MIQKPVAISCQAYIPSEIFFLFLSFKLVKVKHSTREIDLLDIKREARLMSYHCVRSQHMFASLYTNISEHVCSTFCHLKRPKKLSH